jgi:His-Xaa-Ser system protein HxsD
MSTPLAQARDQFPEGLVEVDLHEATASVQLDDSLYPLPAVYGAAYVFIDRCYVLLERPAAGRIRITLARKQPAEADDEAARAAQAEALHSLVGELANELLACAFRHQLAQDNRVLVETVTMQAIAGAMGPPSLADLADFDFTDDALDDPLGIAQSWEEKHGRTLARPGAAEGSEP